MPILELRPRPPIGFLAATLWVRDLDPSENRRFDLQRRCQDRRESCTDFATDGSQKLNRVGTRGLRVGGPGVCRLARTGHCGCQLCREFVFVWEAAESVASANASLGGRSANRDWFGDRRPLPERAMGPMRVVVGDLFAQHVFEVAA